ncbi:catechol 1,2-dioxygenase, partial [Streptomyces sp. ME08-AFT2]|nr:catechol 1,2-dioxygenase [Streptomyces sp. ME08-AFT2]
MGEIVGAGLLAHVPTIVLPEAERLELNGGKEITLVTGLHQLRREVFEGDDYDTVVVLDSHWATTVEFVVTAQSRRAGLFTSEELPRGMCRMPYDFPGDP